jgi:hypothetical protein
MSTFPTTGSFPFQVTSEANKPKVGTLVLTYTLNGDGTITGASILYDPGNGNSTQTIAITFSGTAAAYSGVPTTQPIPNNWNVPNQGAYKYATFLFSPPAGTFTGTFTGQASKDPLAATSDTITWEADPTVPLPKGQKAVHKAAAHKGHK